MKTNFEHYSADLDLTTIEHRTNTELQALHSRALDGDKDAWHELWLYGTKLVLKIVNKLHKEGLLRSSFEDAVGAGNLAIGESLVRWNPRKSAFGTWVWIRVRFAILDGNRADEKKGLTGSSEAAPAVLSNNASYGDAWGKDLDLVDLMQGGLDSEDYEEAVLYENLYAAINELPPRERRYILEVYFEDGSVAELAAVEGISHQMVRKVLARAIDAIRTFLLPGG